MCDPLNSNCPTENPTGPAFADAKTEEGATHVSSMDILQANLSMTGALLTATAYFAYSQFMASKVSDYTTKRDAYKLLDNSKPDYWSYANMTKGFGMLALYGIAWVAQVLATAGVAVEVNKMVQEWGFMGLGTILGTVYSIFIALAYNYCKTSWTTSNSTQTYQAMAQLEWEYSGYLVVNTMIWGAYASHLKVWNHFEHLKKEAEKSE